MDDFFSKAILANLRNRSYFQEFLGDLASGEKQFVRSEGAWKISFYNFGVTGVTLKDSAGGEFILQPGLPGAGGIITPLVLGGHPAVTRDDIIEIDFVGAGASQLYVVYDRMVTKKEDNDYAVDRVMQQLIKGGQWV